MARHMLQARGGGCAARLTRTAGAAHHPIARRMGNWEARPLSPGQRAYAALDAFMGARLVGGCLVVSPRA